MHIYTVFEGKDGIYYDAVGDEFFVVEKVTTEDGAPIYKIEFCDQTIVGLIKDHGYNHFVGTL